MASFDPQSIDRPEFEIFEKLLGRTIPRPTEAQEVHRSIEGLFREAFEKKPYDLVRMSAKSRLRTFWNSIGNDSGLIRDSMDYVVTRLWSRSDSGKQSNARDFEKGSSTNAVEYYRADKHGMLGYVSKHVGWILSDFLKELAKSRANLSLDQQEKIGLMLTTDGTFVRQATWHEAEVDPRENATDRFRPGNTGRAADLASTLDQDRIDRDGRAEVLDPHELRRSVEDDRTPDAASAMRPKHRPLSSFPAIALRGPSRPDMEFFERELHRAIFLPPTPDERAVQLRNLATEVIQSSCHGLPDAEDMLTSVSEWNPFEKPFQSFFPEVIEHINQKERERAIAATKARAERKLGRARPGNFEVKAPLLDSVFPEDLIGATHSTSQSEVSALVMEQSKLWRLHSTPEMLVSPDRPDYLFLTHRLGYQQQPIRDEKTRITALKGLGEEFVNNFFNGAPIMQSHFAEALRRWDPKTSLFNELIQHTVTAIAEAQELPLHEVTLVSRSFLSADRDPEEFAPPRRHRADRAANALEDTCSRVEQTSLFAESRETEKSLADREPLPNL